MRSNPVKRKMRAMTSDSHTPAPPPVMSHLSEQRTYSDFEGPVEPDPCVLSDFILSFSPFNPSVSNPAFLLVLTQYIKLPITGFELVRFSLPGPLLPKIWTWLPLHLVRSQLKCHCLRDTFPNGSEIRKVLRKKI